MRKKLNFILVFLVAGGLLFSPPAYGWGEEMPGVQAVPEEDPGVSVEEARPAQVRDVGPRALRTAVRKSRRERAADRPLMVLGHRFAQRQLKLERGQYDVSIHRDDDGNRRVVVSVKKGQRVDVGVSTWRGGVTNRGQNTTTLEAGEDGDIRFVISSRGAARRMLADGMILTGDTKKQLTALTNEGNGLKGLGTMAKDEDIPPGGETMAVMVSPLGQRGQNVRRADALHPVIDVNVSAEDQVEAIPPEGNRGGFGVEPDADQPADPAAPAAPQAGNQADPVAAAPAAEAQPEQAADPAPAAAEPQPAEPGPAPANPPDAHPEINNPPPVVTRAEARDLLRTDYSQSRSRNLDSPRPETMTAILTSVLGLTTDQASQVLANDNFSFGFSEVTPEQPIAMKIEHNRDEGSQQAVQDLQAMIQNPSNPCDQRFVDYVLRHNPAQHSSLVIRPDPE